MKIEKNFNLDALRDRRSEVVDAVEARKDSRRAFTLMEVMIAMGIFFLAVFSILALVSSNLRNARLLQEPVVDASMVIGDLYQTNILMEGPTDGDFGDLYPGYKWMYNITQIATNGLFEVDLFIIHPNGDSETNLTVTLWRPASPPQGAFKQP
jgi:Tfp pilus assembly protein PilV